MSFHIISSHFPTTKLGTAVSAAQAAEAAEAASTVPLHAFALWDPFGEHPIKSPHNITYHFISFHIIPVVPHKAVAEVSKIGNL